MRAALLLLFFAPACGLGEGTGSLSGALYLHPCTFDSDFGTSASALGAYNMYPTFFAAAPIDDQRRPYPMNRLSLRMQTSGNRIEEADAFILVIANVKPVAEMLGQPIDVGPATNIRATLSLRQSCPQAPVQMELDGQITWTSFGTADQGVPTDFRIEFDDRVAASFSFDVVDRRALTLGGVGGVPAEPAASGHLDGNFDFIVRQGRAAQSP
jgi:hypothetical protein